MKNAFAIAIVTAACAAFSSPLAAQFLQDGFVRFNNTEVPGITCCDRVDPTAWAAFYIVNISNAYWYLDSRDLYDGMGLSVYPTGGPGTGVLELSPTSSSGFKVEFWSIGGHRVTVSGYDEAHKLLGSAEVGGPLDAFGSIGFGPNSLRFVEWSGDGGYAQISTLQFFVPEPAEYALMLAGLGVLGLSARRLRAWSSAKTSHPL